MSKNNSTPDTLFLKEELQEKEKLYHGSYEPFGMTLLTDPGYVSGNRSTMFTNHLKQFVNLLEPDYPKVSTGFENMVGEQSTGYCELEHDTTIFRRIPKFDEEGMENYIYYDFLFDEETETFDMKKKVLVEDLTEKFGFAYDTSTMDSFKEGETIPKGTVIYKTKSYDEEMNYMYGKNATTMFALDPYIIEDAIRIRKGFADSMVSLESERVKVPLNDNDIMRNYYGNSENYKCFPDIGEHTKSKIVCSAMRIHNKQLVYMLKKENLKTIDFNSDSIAYCKGTVIDIDIYSNKTIDEIPDNPFNAQILKYLRMQERLYTRIVETCEEIFDSGYEYSEDISYLYSRAKKILAPNVKYRDENGSVFSHLNIEFHIAREVGVAKGQKITARCGNKGVVSIIVPDEEMPFLENGKPVDLVYSTLGMPNRLITFPLFEQSLTFITDRTIELKIIPGSIKEKEKIWFDLMKRFNKDQGTKQHEYYKAKSTSEKKKWWQDIEAGNYTIVDPPLWQANSEPLYETIKKIYEDYNWLKPYKVFIRKWGRTIPIMKDLIIGSMYVMKLKQTSKKNMSARSTGGLNQRGLPTKTSKAKYHEELYPDTPVNHGDQELGNETISIDPEITARNHMYLRSSKTGRRKAGHWLATSKDGIESFPSSIEETNTNVTILQALFKSMGIRLEFEDEKYVIDTPIDNCDTYYDNGAMFIGSSIDFNEYRKMNKAKEFYEEDGVFVGNSEDYQSILKQYVDELDKDELD